MRFLTDTEIRSLPELLIGEGSCTHCHKTWGLADKAHVRNKQLGGRKQPGPMVLLCRECHDLLHLFPRQQRIDIGSDGLLYWNRNAFAGLPGNLIDARRELFEEVA